jgi:pSer/pThr/pTyr-binding forkhead associated (FHA) protein
MKYRFVLVDNASGFDKTHWILPLPVTVGRCPTTEIFISDPSISRRHCQFALDSQDALVVRDLGSTNGVFVDNQRVEKVVLRPGVDVRIGSITLRVEWTDSEIGESSGTGEIWDLDATQPVKIVRPDFSTENPLEDGGT